MTVTVHPLSVLPIPEYNSLSAEQARGFGCVWCGEYLDSATALALGERTIRKVDRRVGWSPRACRRCALRQAMLALTDHGRSCGQCLDDHTRCPTGLGLVRAVRGARR